MLNRIVVISLLFVWGVSGCQKKRLHEDGARLMKRKCVACHDLQMPPHTSADEKAPPMMAVTFHIRDSLKVDNPSEKRRRFIDFVVDYVLHPSASKSFCDKKSLQSYGVMPSQRGKVSEDELEAIAGYMYDHYDPQRFMQMMVARSKLAAMAPYERVLRSKNCLGCHGVDKDKVAPAMIKIARKESIETIERSIREGSRGQWPGFHLMMPPYKDINASDLHAVARWIKSLVR